MSSVGFDLVLLGFTWFYWVLLGFTGFYRVLPSFAAVVSWIDGGRRVSRLAVRDGHDGRRGRAALWMAIIYCPVRYANETDSLSDAAGSAVFRRCRSFVKAKRNQWPDHQGNPVIDCPI